MKKNKLNTKKECAYVKVIEVINGKEVTIELPNPAYFGLPVTRGW